MKRYIHIAAILILIISSVSCSDLDKVSEVIPQKNQEMESNIIVQKRNLNLPKTIFKQNITDIPKTKSGVIGNSDAFLGCSYKLINGNYIIGDFDNVSHPIVDINAIRAYDNTYISGRRLAKVETTSFAYNTFNRYEYNSTITKKVSSGFSLNFKIFTIGKKKTTTEIFKSSIANTSEATYGELNINFTDNVFNLQASEATRRLFARQFLTKSFTRSLYNSQIKSILDTYGDFVLTGYYTGGKAFALFAGQSSSNLTSDVKEKDMEKSINASVSWKGNSASGELGLTGGNTTSQSETFNSNNTYIYVKTLGGIRDGNNANLTATGLKDLNINLTTWMQSLNDESKHTIIDIVDSGLYPLSGFVLEQNFKQRMDDTANGILEDVPNLLPPSIEIVRVLVRTTPSYESLYDVAAVLITRQGDYIILSDGKASSATDEELRLNENNEIFMQKVNQISADKSTFFSSDIEISYNKKKKLNPLFRSSLCIDLSGFNENNFYRFYNEKNSIEYIYDPSTRLCFSYYIDEGDDEILDIYGIRSWVESLPEKKISIASLANSYKIIGL